ncbi:MAG: hypothetical protein R3A44_04500 [Caldilineaceae bacterium]
MNGLHQKFGDRVDFINLNVDNHDATATRLSFGMRNRSHYVLLDAHQNRLAEWFGPLNQPALEEQITELLASIEP